MQEKYSEKGKSPIKQVATSQKCLVATCAYSYLKHNFICFKR